MNRKLLIIMIALLLSLCLVTPAYCSNLNWGETDTIPLLKRVLPVDILTLGTARGASTTMASGDTAVSVSYKVVAKIIGEGIGVAGTLANGTPGQILKIEIVQRNGSGTFILTPTTCSNFATLTFDAKDEYATLLYVDNTVGWIWLATNATIGH